MSVTQKFRWMFIAVVIVAALWSGVWWWLADAARARTEAWFAAERDAGRIAEHGAIAVSGYPFRLQVTLSDVTLGDPQPKAGDWRLRAPTVIAYALVYQPNLALAEATGPFHVAFNASAGFNAAVGRAPFAGRFEAEVSAQSAVASLRWGLDGARHVAIDAQTLAAKIPGAPFPFTADRLRGEVLIRAAGEADAATTNAANATENAADSPPAIVMKAQIDAATAPVGAPAGFGPRIDLAGVEAAFAPSDSFNDLGDILVLMRDAGRRIAIEKLALRWGPLSVDADGDVGLDPQARPEGRITARIGGGSTVLAELEKRGFVSPSGGGFMQNLLFGGTIDAKHLTLPLIAQDGVLFLGPAPIGRLSPLIR